jgi:uncharacterized protein YjbI with pentapeptide repeats
LLQGADLSGADLWDAHLSGANLIRVTNITPEKLEKVVKSLEGATMPGWNNAPLELLCGW